MSFDGNININIILAALQVGQQDFGTPLFVAEESGMGAGFTERIRFYDSQDAVDADASDLGATAVAALTVMFSQDLVPARVACGRADIVAPETYSQALDAINAENSNWYGIAIQSRTDTDISSAASWADTNKRLYVAQCKDADILLAPETDVFGVLKAAGNDHTLGMYHSDDAEWADCAWLANRLAVNPDLQTTIWSYVTLDGITAQDLTPTEMVNLEAKNANVYSTFYGVGATGMGTVADGTKADLILTADWVKARLEEKLAQHLLSYSNAGLKIPYTDKGINTFRQKTKEVLDLGERTLHFAPDTSAIQMPKLADVPAADITNRVLNYTFTTEPAGAIEKVGTLNGYVAVSL